MKFTTQVEIPNSNFTIGYDTPTMIVGSCFAQNIGNKMAEWHLPISLNPCGVAFNPISVINTFDLIINKIKIGNDALIQNGDLWCSLYHSTQFSKTDRNLLLEGIEAALTSAREIFSNAKFVIITLGTAWIYRHLKSGLIVNNCHKLPDGEFSRELLSVDKIVESFQRLFSETAFFDKQIILTVSPVRHIKDSLHGNNISKSTLLLAINQLVAKSANVHYFPAYEIVLDELRDYRFYADDLTHPSTIAIEYIWEKFSDWAITLQTRQIATELRKIDAAMAHRPINQDSQQHASFRKQMFEKVVYLKNKYPNINLDRQLEFFNDIF